MSAFRLVVHCGVERWVNVQVFVSPPYPEHGLPPCGGEGDVDAFLLRRSATIEKRSARKCARNMPCVRLPPFLHGSCRARRQVIWSSLRDHRDHPSLLA